MSRWTTGIFCELVFTVDKTSMSMLPREPYFCRRLEQAVFCTIINAHFITHITSEKPHVTLRILQADR